MANEIRLETSFSSFDSAEWNLLSRGDFVFADHRFLMALEESQSIGKRTGWSPRILSLRKNGRLEGAITLFEKTNSYGEYIFDWSWANAYQSSGLAYYPKLTAAVPFTPATGPKFLLHPHAEVDVRHRLLEAARSLFRESGSFSSLHFLFITNDEATELGAEGLFVRHSFQYHWRNRGYSSFDEFLAALRRKRRYEIRREREAASQLPVRVELLTGGSLSIEHARTMHAFYLSTLHKMGGIPYLTLNFFERVFSEMKDNILFVQASAEDGTPVAGALNFFAGKTLYGRYWGAIEEMRHLHFELCYYRTIEWAIQNGIELFEAGAQGEHKFPRGFSPTLCLSAHEIRDLRFAHAIEAFIEEEKEGIRAYFDSLTEHDPYKDKGISLEGGLT